MKDEHPFLQQRILDKPSVFVDKNGDILRLTAEVDIEVIHPKTYYKNGRPHWLYEEGIRQAYFIEKDLVQIEYPMFVKAFCTR